MSYLIRIVGSNLKMYRISSGLTQQSLALSCDIEPSLIGKIERCSHNASLRTLHRISQTLHVPSYELFRESDPSDQYGTINRYLTRNLTAYTALRLCKPQQLYGVLDSALLEKTTVLDIEHGAC